MIALFFYVVVAFGLAYVAGYSKITLPFREWVDPHISIVHRDHPTDEVKPEGDVRELLASGLWVRLSASEARQTPNAWRTPVKPLAAPRQWLLALMECPACLGFWTGVGSQVVLALAGLEVHLVPVALPVWACAILLGFFTVGTNLLLGIHTRLIQVD